MVLQNVGYKDLIVCSMVCKRFHKLIKEAAEFSYTVELGVDGLVDGLSSDQITSERLQILLDLRKRWRTLDWVKRETVNLHPTKPKHNNMHYAQGIFSQAMRLSDEEGQYDSSIFCTTLPTRTMEAADYGSLGENDGLWYRAFCMDPAADVVISVGFEHEDLDDEELETQSESFKSCLTFYPRSLSSNGTRLHPSCRCEPSGFITGTYDARIMEPQIAGDMVGVTITDDLDESIVIYNWHSGDLVVKMTPLGENPMCTVEWAQYTERALLLFTSCDESSDGAPFTVTAGAVKHIVTLLLSEVAEGQFFSGYINTSPCASYQPRGMPFKVEDPSRILVYDAGDHNSQSSVRMVVHTDVFIKGRELLSKGSDVISKTRQIPWDAWGPEYTRLFMARAHNYVDLSQRWAYALLDGHPSMLFAAEGQFMANE
ncbi:hypothetical protein EWM64_g3403 [Hericium alpestre]|uniref:F-box domain-containing protein n=1 Tax=Hericium alpestre TaxID=135208 RepID=A0A4Z0A2R2_9AGAM|nr:hypothetical protein EWM64_g3403 [Hericium alpestre]